MLFLAPALDNADPLIALVILIRLGDISAQLFVVQLYHSAVAQLITKLVFVPSWYRGCTKTTITCFFLTRSPLIEVTAGPAGRDKLAVALARFVGYAYKHFPPH